jgi:hypothetical protein
MIKFEDERFYIGCRQSKVPANEDIKYWGSPVTYKHLWEDTSLSKNKHILKVCNSFEEMRDMESEFIKDAWKKYPNLCLNRNSAACFHPEVSKRAGKLGAQKAYEMGVGIHAESYKPRRKKVGKKCYESGLGIHAESFKPRRKEISKKNGEKLKKEEKGIFGLSKEEKSKYSSMGAKNAGDLNVKLGRGICDPKLQKNRKEWCSLGGRTSHKKFKFISPEGILHEGTNYTQWCRDNNFHPMGFSNIMTGRQKITHGGWKLG